MSAAVLVLILAATGGFELPPTPKKEPEKIEPRPVSDCERWKGRALLSRYDPKKASTGCAGKCEVRLIESSGATGRWEVTGAQCMNTKGT